MPKTRQTKTGYSTDQQALADLQESTPHPFLDALLGHRDQTKLRQIVEGLRRAIGRTAGSTPPLTRRGPARVGCPRWTPICKTFPPDQRGARNSRHLRRRSRSRPPDRRLFADRNADHGAFFRGRVPYRGVPARRRPAQLRRAQVFEVEPDAVTPEMRTKVKAMSYGLAYGLSAYGLAKQLGSSRLRPKT
jgi:DNA polymerase-1